MKTTTDVLIVGAGPVGLLLATELSRDGVDAVLIDAMPERSFFSKALGVTPRTLELFDDLGIAQDAIDAGIWLRSVSSFSDGVPGPGIDVPTDLPFGSLSLAQFETERLLEACLRRHGGAVHYGWTLTGFTRQADAVNAELAGPQGETRTIVCKWLAGCDGAHSKVRPTLGLVFEGAHFPQTFVLADLEVEWDLPRGGLYRFSHGAPGAADGTTLIAVPVPGSVSRYRLSTTLPEALAAQFAVGAAAPTLERLVAVMGPMLPDGTRLSELHWSSVYRVSHRIVPAYARGRVFLAGDAAHIHPPVGGQGMNTGLQDAHNLAWKLVLASRGLAAPALLDSYSAERRPVGLDVVENTSRALNDVLARRTQLPGMRETQLLISYRDSALVLDERPDAASAPLAAGDRVPNADGLCRPYVGHAIRLHELLGRGRHVLLGYIGDDPTVADTLADLQHVLRDTVGEAACTYAITPAGQMPPGLADLPMLEDRDGRFAAGFGAQPGMAWLARPDGYLGWCSTAPSAAGLRSYLARIVRPAA